MKIFSEIIVTVLLFTIFAFTHSYLAQLSIKQRIAEGAGSKIAFYRLFYNTVSVIFFLLFWKLSPDSGYYLYDLGTPYDLIIVSLQILSLFGIIWAFKSSRNSYEFLGLSQIKRYLKDEYKISDLEEKNKLVFSGAYRFCRHPVYFFTILFLGLRPAMSVFYLVFFICSVVYFNIGSLLEEKRLEKLLGEDYIEYKNKVPGIIPFKILRK